jgi:DNA-binding NtrC family response regulator
MARIVIADNSPFMVGSLKFLLERIGHRVEETVNEKKSVLPVYQKVLPDIFFLDANMEFEGNEPVIRSVKALYPAARFILVTATGSEMPAAEIARTGASGQIKKPYDLKMIEEEVKRVLKAG